MTVTDEMLMAYADGELDDRARAAVDAALAADPALEARLARHRLLRGRLQDAYAPVADEPTPQRLLDLLARPAPVVDLAAARAKRGNFLQWGSMAACLAAGLIVGAAIPRMGQGPLVGADMAARGHLAKALDKQLASNPDAASPVRVGLTFRTAADDYCRTFSAQTLAGVACREEAGWKVRMAMSQAAEAGDYRTAAGTPAAVMAAVEAMIEGEPLDADAEAKARESGWR